MYYVCPSRSIYGSKVYKSKPTSDSNIHHKPIRSNYISFINSSVSTHQISFIFLLSLSPISVYYKYGIFKTNTFNNLFLVIIILLTKLTCIRKFFLLYISCSNTFLHSNLNTYIVFQSFRTILLLNKSEVSFFTKDLCIFAILSLIALNFPKSNVHRNLFQNILKNIGNVLHIFIFIFFVLVIWQVNAFCITLFFTVIITMILALVFIVFTAMFLNMFIKLFYIIGIFTHFSIIICISFLRIIFRIFYYFMFGWVFFIAFAFLLRVCFDVLHAFICLLILTIIIYQQVLLFFIFMLILTKLLIAFKVIITLLQKIFGYFFQPRFYF